MHKDGIKINLQSPEAFDDVFFQTFTDKQVLENLSSYISLILERYKKNLYLSKNNNNYKRIDLIQSILPNSKFIIPFRSALQHSNSLLFQHFHFCELQKKNKFILKYMSYLGHFEFGLKHQSWNLPINFVDQFCLNYWLEQWFLFYEILIQKYSNNPSVIFVSYEALCDNQITQKKILKELNLNLSTDFSFLLSNQKIENKYDKNLLDNCLLLEKKLSSISIHVD